MSGSLEWKMLIQPLYLSISPPLAFSLCMYVSLSFYAFLSLCLSLSLYLSLSLSLGVARAIAVLTWNLTVDVGWSWWVSGGRTIFD